VSATEQGSASNSVAVAEADNAAAVPGTVRVRQLLIAPNRRRSWWQRILRLLSHRLPEAIIRASSFDIGCGIGRRRTLAPGRPARRAARPAAKQRKHLPPRPGRSWRRNKRR
jgi:hypothetical protein